MSFLAALQQKRLAIVSLVVDYERKNDGVVAIGYHSAVRALEGALFNLETDRRSEVYFCAHLFRKPFHTFRDVLCNGGTHVQGFR
jgi:hypothetical protein